MKRVIVCCDGTWNTPDQPHPTNVAKIRVMIPQTDPAGVQQRVHYDQGVGTGKWDKIRGGMLGWGLGDNVKEAYAFLVKNYDPGDELYFFGFSRGAYTVRSLGGLVRNAGLLRRENADRLDEAYDLYRRRDPKSHPREKEATEFRQKYSHEPRIKLIGVWDTVGALGIPLSGPFAIVNFGLRFHDTDLSGCVENAYHALAIDERRRPFKPTLWTQKPENKGKQVLEQVWFAGVHSNVGGGYADSGLADVALRWMLNRARPCGLHFDPEQVRELLHPNERGKLENSQKWYYKIVGLLSGGANLIRTLGEEKCGCEWAADLAVIRLVDAAMNYDPPNLKSYLDHQGATMPVGEAEATPLAEANKPAGVVAVPN